MNITSVTVSYSRTHSLPGYSNIKMGMSLTAEVAEGESALKVEQFLLDHAKIVIHEQIDTALVAADEPAVYSTDPRFDVAWHSGAFVIVPTGALDKAACYNAGLRLAHALRRAAELGAYHHDPVVDCSDGDLSKLPAAESDDDMTVAECIAPMNAMAHETLYGVDYEDEDESDDPDDPR